MTLLILGLLLFLGTHSVRIFADGWRAARIRAMGLNAWKGVYALVSLFGFVLIVVGFGETRGMPELWTPPFWTRHVTALLVLPAFVLLVAAYVPGTHIKAAVGHPMVAGVKLWAFAHLLSNGRPGACCCSAPSSPGRSWITCRHGAATGQPARVIRPGRGGATGWRWWWASSPMHGSRCGAMPG